LCAAVLAASCLLVQSASANLLFSEAFNYTSGSSLGNSVNPSDGLAWAGGNSGLTIASSSLSYPGLAPLGGNALSIVNASSGSSYNPWGSVNGAISAGTVYYSFLFDPTVVDSGNNYFTGMNPDNLTLNGSPDAADAYYYSSGKIGIRSSGASTTTFATPLSLNTTYLVVLEYNFSTSTASLFLNPTPGLSQPAATLSVVGNGSITSINNVAFKAQSGSGSYFVDDLRVGTTWEDVTPTIPEPSTLALMGFGCLSLIAAIRRRRS
jgi:hypothetical protein